jgi:hypothetical protein
MFKLEFKTDNAAFEGMMREEISNILRDVQRRVNTGYLEGKIRDSNGNTIGSYQVTE